MNKKEKKQKRSNADNIREAIILYDRHELFGSIYRRSVQIIDGGEIKSKPACSVSSNGIIKVNASYKESLTVQEWFYLIVHQYLHLAFGHFDAEKITGENKSLQESGLIFQENNWELACNLYNMKFLLDLKIGKCPLVQEGFDIFNYSEKRIYENLVENEWNESQILQAEQIRKMISMEGLRNPLVHKNTNPEIEEFASKLARAAKNALRGVNARTELQECTTKTKEASEWFILHYPLLGGLASGFRIIEDYRECQMKEIQIAAVNVEEAIIYINPAANLSREELKFVLAHEYLHAGLMHYERCQRRDMYLWNVACDYVINGWLYELQIGCMPEGVLYDETLRNISAESVYDRLVQNMRNSLKLMTLRGYGKGDVIGNGNNRKSNADLEEFYKNSLKQGLVYHETQGRGYLPLGLVEEIRALGMPPIPWDVELAKWFEQNFPLMEKHYSYARPSRRQSSSPNIPRPRLTNKNGKDYERTFGVVVDTSGSMSKKMLGMAIGSIASYAQAREVARVRVIFCDARAYDAGYITPEELLGRVEVTGRGGTVLQPGIDYLEEAKDFPKDGPILIITDGAIEDKLAVKREHAYLLPKGSRLPFKGRGKIFYLNNV